MKRTTLSLVLGAIAVTVGIAAAQGAARGERMFERFDASSDGQITVDEARSASATRFGEIDVDRDGTVSRDAMVAYRQKRMAERMARIFSRLDGDGNGTLDQAEFEKARDFRFRRLDTDGNGAITLEEFRARMGHRGG